MFIVWSLKVVQISEVEHNYYISSMVKSIGDTLFVHCIGVVHISVGPLSEVSCTFTSMLFCLHDVKVSAESIHHSHGGNNAANVASCVILSLITSDNYM